MLVLTRQRNEEIVIGADIVVRVLEIRGDKVRIGISCPRTIPVHRREVAERIRREEEGEGPMRGG